MHKFLLLLVFISFKGAAQAQRGKFIETGDITLFWKMYDNVNAATDSLQRVRYIEDFMNNASPGQKAMLQARRYSVADYYYVTTHFPRYWKAMRRNMKAAEGPAREIAEALGRFHKLYPSARPATVYYTVGAFRSGGTTMDGMVLIGSEIALADSSTPTEEFPERYSYLTEHFKTDPAKGIVFLNVHEYVHTQQKTSTGYCLLSQCVIEGVAEFVAEKAYGNPSPTPQLAFGKANDAQIRAAFEKEMFSPLFSNWLWNSSDNIFKMRDLGYYIGYAICGQFYNKKSDKQEAIKTMIELDYNDEAALMAFVDASGYFPLPAKQYLDRFSSNRPRVTGIREFANGSSNVSPSIRYMTIEFSEPMDKGFRNLGTGPLGEGNLLNVVSFEGFSADGKSVTYGIALEPGKKQQLTVREQFRDTDGFPLEPYLIEIVTGKE